ncbi:MAG: hypothetical protein A2252_08660 [Elusimicrobia bacterium RIFOXYA2_FULL_39_19]|nr:MAG: hypothetical protein A2252_08660 [Elusimicrobia bacterium RIFOXYA2_FULL_39_19]
MSFPQVFGGKPLVWLETFFPYSSSFKFNITAEILTMLIPTGTARGTNTYPMQFSKKHNLKTNAGVNVTHASIPLCGMEFCCRLKIT